MKPHPLCVPAAPYFEQVGSRAGLAPVRSSSAPSTWTAAVADRQAVEMIRSFDRHGGVASGDEVAAMLRTQCDQPLSRVAHWVLSHEVVHFVWRSQTLVPLFQFARPTMSVRPSTLAVLCELSPVFDDWDIANWFAMPNSWLADTAPIDVIEHDLDAVLQAARADRFIAFG